MAENNWTREQTILALNLYFRHKDYDKNSETKIVKADEIKELATLIGRNEAALKFKLGNLGSVDTGGKAGFGNGSGLDKEIWTEFKDNRELLAQESERLMAIFKSNYQVNMHLDNNSGASVPMVNESTFTQSSKNPPIFKARSLITMLSETGYQFDVILINRFISSLLAKRFCILTGLSGSGKTRLAILLSKWFSEEDIKNYRIVSVGADWTSREPLLGFANALVENGYVKPDNGVVDLLISANENPDVPHFLVLDEMNLSHTERYFADFLSTMESGEKITLHPGPGARDGVPPAIALPDNLFIIGTVNIDETTYMFSPKVLDRANVIEFRVSQSEMLEFLDAEPNTPSTESITGNGASMGADFMRLAREGINNEETVVSEARETLKNFFPELKKAGAEFGYRTAGEFLRFCDKAKKIDTQWNDKEIIDAAIMQKLLPKLFGSRAKLTKTIPVLAALCFENMNKDEAKILLDNFAKDEKNPQKDPVYKLSYDKLSRMYKTAIENGFASFAEA